VHYVIGAIKHDTPAAQKLKENKMLNVQSPLSGKLAYLSLAAAYTAAIFVMVGTMTSQIL
jgi:hypothetical protein